jgi:hypothetical protein
MLAIATESKFMREKTLILKGFKTTKLPKKEPIHNTKQNKKLAFAVVIKTYIREGRKGKKERIFLKKNLPETTNKVPPRREEKKYEKLNNLI